MKTWANVSLACAVIIGVGAMASAQTPGSLRDLIGARAAGAEREMGARGYVNTGGSQGDDRAYTNWYNARTRTCVTVATMNGRYNSITTSPMPDCRPTASTLPSGPLRPRPVYPSRPDDRPIYSGANIDLGLVCYGEGQRSVAAARGGYEWDSRRDRYVYGNRTELAAQAFDTSVTIQMSGNGGRIRLPRRLVPPISSRGQDGWWDLSDVSTSRNAIRARYRLNGLNRPTVSIDRRSGRITIQGTADYAFRGTCDEINAEDHRRF